MGRLMGSSGGGKILVVGRRLYNRPRTTSPDQWLGGKKRKRSLGEAIIRMAPHYPNPTAHQKQIASYGVECGRELKGKLAGKDWKTIKQAMGACVMIKAGKTPPEAWKKVYESLKG